MIKILEDSKAYKEILDSQTMKTITIPYHTDTGIIVSEDNIEELVEKDWDEYDTKMKLIQTMLPDFIVDSLRNKLRYRIYERMGKSLLNIEYIYVNSNTIKDAAQTIEALPEFVEWCVE